MALAVPSGRFVSLSDVFRDLMLGFKPTQGAPMSEDRRATDFVNTASSTGTRAEVQIDHTAIPTYTYSSAPHSGDLSTEALGLASSMTATDNPDYLTAALAAAAESKDERAFVAASAMIEWRQQGAEKFLQGVQWALAAGAHRAARQLAILGAGLHPDSARLETAARVLAPPEVIARHLPADPSGRANRDWLMLHGNQYRGMWVALRNGKLLDAAASFEELTARFGKSPEILYTRIS